MINRKLIVASCLLLLLLVGCNSKSTDSSNEVVTTTDTSSYTTYEGCFPYGNSTNILSFDLYDNGSISINSDDIKIASDNLSFTEYNGIKAINVSCNGFYDYNYLVFPVETSSKISQSYLDDRCSTIEKNLIGKYSQGEKTIEYREDNTFTIATNDNMSILQTSPDTEMSCDYKIIADTSNKLGYTIDYSESTFNNDYQVYLTTTINSNEVALKTTTNTKIYTKE